MDLIKKLTGKNPSEYEVVAKSLVNNSDVELYEKLVKQDDFLFDFVKENVAQQIINYFDNVAQLHETIDMPLNLQVMYALSAGIENAEKNEQGE